jgi:hypothetical protein
MSVESIMRNPNMDFAAKKKALIDMTQTADQHLRAQQLTLTAANTVSQIQNRNIDNRNEETNIALKQAGMYAAAQQPIPKAIAERAGLLPSSEPASESTIGTDLSKSLQSKIVSGQRSNKDLYNESVQAGRPGKTATGLPIAKPGTSQHEVDNAIDLPKNLSADERRELAQKGYFQPLGIDSVHWEKISPKTTEAAGGISLDKPGRGVSKPSTDTPSSFVGATGTVYTPKDEREKQLFANVAGPYKEPGVNNINQNNAVTVAAKELGIGVENLSIKTNKGENVPSRGAFSNLKTDTFFGAAASAATGPMSSLDTQQFEALALPLIRMQAQLILKGAGTAEDRKSLEKSLMTQAFAQSKELGYQKLAEFTQSVRAGIEGNASNPTLNKAQRETLVDAYKKINNFIPFEPKDVFQWQEKAKEGSKQTFGDYVANKYPSEAKAPTTTSAASKKGVDTSNPWLQ